VARTSKARNEFRKKNTKDGRGHPTYIYRERGNQYDYLSLTHSERTEGEKNIPLKKNPNPKDRRKAHVRPKVETAHVSSFGKRLLGWFFGDDDKDTVNKLKK
jgi:hypothetical protein